MRNGAWVRSTAAVPTPGPVSVKIGVVEATCAQSIEKPCGAAGSVTSTYVRPFRVLTSIPEPFVGETRSAVGPSTWNVKVCAGAASPLLSDQAPVVIVTVPGAQRVPAEAPEKS